MSASLWWLAVRMCCVFVLDLMPSCLSNKDCKALWRIKAWTLIPGCYRGTLSQQESYEAAVWFGDFVNWNTPVSLIHCDVLLFAKPTSLQEIKCKPDRTCLQKLCVFSIDFCYVRTHIFLSEKNTCRQRIYMLLTPARQRVIQSWDECLSQMEPWNWWRLLDFLSRNREVKAVNEDFPALFTLY